MIVYLIKSAWSHEYIQAKDIISAIKIYQLKVPKEIAKPDRDVIFAEMIGELMNV